jgi:hypothetical protein
MNDPTQEIMYLQQKADFNKIKKLGAILWQECKFFYDTWNLTVK